MVGDDLANGFGEPSEKLNEAIVLYLIFLSFMLSRHLK